MRPPHYSDHVKEVPNVSFINVHTIISPCTGMTSDSSSVEDDETTEEQSHTTNNYTTHITDNITITQPVCDDQQ